MNVAAQSNKTRHDQPVVVRPDLRSAPSPANQNGVFTACALNINPLPAFNPTEAIERKGTPSLAPLAIIWPHRWNW